MDDLVKNSIAMRGEVTCPIALAAEVLSDQWTVIVLRDIAFFNQRTFGAILENNNERIPRPTLANRLKRLCDIGLLKARGDAKHSQRKVYSLTEAALGLLPVMVEMANWSLSQDAMKAEKIDFLTELSAPESRAMTDYLDKLRVTHLAM
jgi:DNA-binding HxlR family transcriptional regulator